MSVTDRILSALTTVIRMNVKVEEMAGLMREQQRRIDELNGRLIRAETMLELLVYRAVASSGPALESDTWLTDTNPRPVATERVPAHWLGREP